jgi:hypothetical protein
MTDTAAECDPGREPGAGDGESHPTPFSPITTEGKPPTVEAILDAAAAGEVPAGSCDLHWLTNSPEHLAEYFRRATTWRNERGRVELAPEKVDAAAAALLISLDGLLNAIEAVLRSKDEAVYEDRDAEWDDKDEELLLAWRQASGSTGEWEWWAREIGGDQYDQFGDTREQVIERARAEFGPHTPFEIVEACNWQDDIRAEESLFAATRNHELITATGEPSR